MEVSWLHQGMFHRVFSRGPVVLLRFITWPWGGKTARPVAIRCGLTTAKLIAII